MSDHIDPIRVVIAAFTDSIQPADQDHLAACPTYRRSFDRAVAIELAVRLDEARGICGLCRRRPCACDEMFYR